LPIDRLLPQRQCRLANQSDYLEMTLSDFCAKEISMESFQSNLIGLVRLIALATLSSWLLLIGPCMFLKLAQ